LQISSDERARVSRIADLFSEEDLARHLQIMLRTHGELGYRQEQRFHLELGLLKMAHAQRLLPIEQLLSDAVASAPPRTAPRPVLASNTEARRAQTPTLAKSSSVSPFAADSARKGNPKAESSSDIAISALCSADTLVREPGNLVIMGSAAPALEEPSPEPIVVNGVTGVSPVREDDGARDPSQELRPEATAESLRDAILNALTNQPMLVSMLEGAQWTLHGNTLLAKVAASSTMIEMSFNAEARRVASAAASALAGRPIKLQVETGGAPQPATTPRRASPESKSNGSARSRAEQDPIVQRMKDKFGAEIRTVIDYREKG
jgi:DNA polymerase-3 subunit gamma/tau